MKRLSKIELVEITGKKTPGAQMRWFKTRFKITLPYDSEGPVITQSAFEGLVAKACGLPVIATPVELRQPQLHLSRTQPKEKV